MKSHLDAIHDWHLLAKQANYRAPALARLAGCSHRQLARFFAEKFGASPSKSLNEFRLQEGYRLLQEGKLVKQVATELGFKSASHFSQMFKTRFGISPLAVNSQKRFPPGPF